MGKKSYHLENLYRGVNKMTYCEPKYCYNCDSEATVYVEWKNKEGVTLRTYMCSTCCDAFELGQCTPEPAVQLE